MSKEERMEARLKELLLLIAYLEDEYKKIKQQLKVLREKNNE